MGGKIEKDFTQKVTHLIASMVGSEKYKAAVLLEVPILRSSWIIDCYQQKKLLDIKDYKLKALEGCVIGVTGLKSSMYSIYKVDL